MDYKSFTKTFSTDSLGLKGIAIKIYSRCGTYIMYWYYIGTYVLNLAIANTYIDVYAYSGGM